MFGEIIRHRMERVDFYTLPAFKKLMSSNFGIPVKDIHFDEKNEGITIGRKYWTWDELCAELNWFDQCEVVTDKNEKEKVMIWLNVD